MNTLWEYYNNLMLSLLFCYIMYNKHEPINAQTFTDYCFQLFPKSPLFLFYSHIFTYSYCSHIIFCAFCFRYWHPEKHRLDSYVLCCNYCVNVSDASCIYIHTVRIYMQVKCACIINVNHPHAPFLKLLPDLNIWYIDKYKSITIYIATNYSWIMPVNLLELK